MPDLAALRGFPGHGLGYLCGLGPWLSEDARVAEFSARLKGEAAGPPMLVYEVVVELGTPRAYDGCHALRLDLALNPLRGGTVYGDYGDWERDGCPERGEEDARLGHDEAIERFRQHLVSCGTRALSVEGCVTDLPIVRRDICAVDPGAARIVGCHEIAPRPEGAFEDHRGLGSWLASQGGADWQRPAPAGSRR